MVQRLDDVGRPGRAGLVVGRVGDRDPADECEEREEVGLVEHRRDRLPPARLPDQREVPDRQPLEVVVQAGQLDQAIHAVARPGGPVDDEPVGRSPAAPAPAATRASGSPGHQTVTGRSWMSSGATSAEQVPAGLAAGGQEDQLRAGLRRVRRAAARSGPGSGRRSTAARPGSAPWTTSVRDGWRPVSRLMVSALRSPTSGWRATTTRFITDVRAAMWRPPWTPSSRLDRQVRLRPDPRQLALDPLDRLCPAHPAQRRLAGSRRLGEGDLPAARRSRADGDHLAERPLRAVLGPPPPGPSPFRSGATGGPRAPACRRRPPGPRCRPRSSGTRAPASSPRCRGSGRRSTTPPRPRRRA